MMVNSQSPKLGFVQAQPAKMCFASHEQLSSAGKYELKMDISLQSWLSGY